MSYPMPLLRATPLVQLLFHIDIIGLYPQSSIAQDTFQLSPSSIPLIYSVYHMFFTSSIGCHLGSQVLKKINSKYTFSGILICWNQNNQLGLRTSYLPQSKLMGTNIHRLRMSSQSRPYHRHILLNTLVKLKVESQISANTSISSISKLPND